MKNSQTTLTKTLVPFLFLLFSTSQLSFGQITPPPPAKPVYCSDDLKEVCASISPSGHFHAADDIRLTINFDSIFQKPIENISAYLYNSEKDLLVFDVSVTKISDREFLVSSNPLMIPGDWELRLEFDHGLFYQIFIPLQVLP